MDWQILKQLCNSPTVSRKLTLLRESTQKGNENSLIEHYAMSLNIMELFQNLLYDGVLIPTIIPFDNESGY